MATKKVMKPDVVRGGIAIPLKGKTNYYYMSGRKHKNGGIDIGRNPRTGLEVEDGEVMHIADNEIKVFSSVPFLNGKSPAQKVLGGENPDTVFKEQEAFKDKNGLNDDGTKKRMGGLSNSENSYNKKPSIKKFTSPNKARYQAIFKKVKKEVDNQRNFNAPNKYIAKQDNTYVAPIFGKQLVKNKLSKLNQFITAATGAVRRKLTGETAPATVINLTDKNVSKIDSNTENASSILFNEFVEDNANNIRPKKDFINTKDIFIGDHKIPLNKISLYYGVEDGKFKVGNINNFDNNTIIVPIRNHNVGRITKIINNTIPKDSMDIMEDEYDRLLNLSKKERNRRVIETTQNKVKPTFSDYFNGFIFGQSPQVLAGNRYYRKNHLYYPSTQYDDRMTYIRNRIKYPIKFITENNDTLTSEQIGINNNKSVFGDENGNSVFINGINRLNNKQINELNGILNKNPLYPVLVDNGRYMKYYKNVDNLHNYNRYVSQDFYRDPKSLYVIGTTNNKKRMGGLSRSKDYGSKSKPYPNVDSKDFAGGNRSYPIPTKADAVDALRLAGLHGRDDVKVNVYSKYPELRKKKLGGDDRTLPEVLITPNVKDNLTYLKMLPYVGEKDARDLIREKNALMKELTTPETHGGKFGGGSFGGDGAGGRFIVPKNYTSIGTFNEAFDKAYDAGEAEFRYGEKFYNTNKEENPIRERNNRFVGSSKSRAKLKTTDDYEYGIGPYRLRGLENIPIVMPNISKTKKKYKAGGVYSVTVNGETKLKRFPSTGSRTKAALGKLDDNVPEYLRLNENPSNIWRKPLDGSIWENNTNKVKVTSPSSVDLLNPNAPKESFSPLRSNVPKEHYVNPGVLELFGNSPLNTLAKYHHIPTYIPTSRWNNFSNKAKEYIKEHPETVSDAIGLASNTIGGLISHGINRRMLDKLDYFPQPMARSAAKLKTRININPQLDKMRESLAAYENDINNSTSSSNVALARRQRARFANTLQTNNIYANRENTETELINKDRLNQQSVTDANVRDYNTWLQNQTTFRNSLLEKKAENDIGLIETINSGIQNMLTNREKRNTEKQNVAALSFANPDLPVEVLYEQGLISKRVLDAYRKAYRAKKKENNENNKETNNV